MNADTLKSAFRWFHHPLGSDPTLYVVSIHQKKSDSTKDRYTLCLAHLRQKLKDDLPMGDFWIPELREYCDDRRKEGAANGTIGWELSTLSKLFGVVDRECQDHRHHHESVLKFLKDEPLQSEQRNAYLSRDFVEKLIDVTAEKTCQQNQKGHLPPLPRWLEPIVWTGYYTGMRRGEILNLRSSQVRLIVGSSIWERR